MGPGMPSLVLASGSRYRARLLEEAGIDAEVRTPRFDERSLDEHFEAWGVDRYVVEVARHKAASVAGDVAPGTVIVAADQVAVADGRLLTKPLTADLAVEMLASMSGRTHELVNGVVATVAPVGPVAFAVDRHLITMAPYDIAAARAYVERFEPLDCVGAYRIEDDAGLIDAVSGSGRDGVIGLPLGIVRSLIERVTAHTTAP